MSIMTITIPNGQGELHVQLATRRGPSKTMEDRSSIFRFPSSKKTFIVISDGMGGQPEGELCAEMALHLMVAHFITLLSLRVCLKLETLAQLCVLHAQCEIAKLCDGSWKPGATALVGVLGDDGELGISWLGDSLAIGIDGDEIQLLTQPHNANADTEYKKHYPNVSGAQLTRFLGKDGFILTPQTTNVRVEPGARILLGSDGMLDLFEPHVKNPGVQALWCIPSELLSDNTSVVEIGYERSLSWIDLDSIWSYEI